MTLVSLLDLFITCTLTRPYLRHNLIQSSIICNQIYSSGPGCSTINIHRVCARNIYIYIYCQSWRDVSFKSGMAREHAQSLALSDTPTNRRQSLFCRGRPDVSPEQISACNFPPCLARARRRMTWSRVFVSPRAAASSHGDRRLYMMNSK